MVAGEGYFPVHRWYVCVVLLGLSFRGHSALFNELIRALGAGVYGLGRIGEHFARIMLGFSPQKILYSGGLSSILFRMVFFCSDVACVRV